MRVFHFTSENHLEYLLGVGELVPTESNIGAKDTPQSRAQGYDPIGHHIGPDVVWFTTHEDPRLSGITSGPAEKGAIRVVADVPTDDLRHWPEWSRQQGIDERWYEGLARRCTPEDWWVVERRVPWTEWLSIDEPETLTRDQRREREKLRRKRKPLPELPVARVIWQRSDGLTPTMTADEVLDTRITLLEDYGDGTFLVRDGHGKEFRWAPS